MRPRQVGVIPEPQHAGVHEQPTIAVLGQPGEPVEVDDLDAGPFQRLDQRIGKPLRELVEWNDLRRLVIRPRGWVAPRVPKFDSAERETARPDRAEVDKNGFQDGRRTEPSIFGLAGEEVEEPPGTWIVGEPEDLR